MFGLSRFLHVANAILFVGLDIIVQKLNGFALLMFLQIIITYYLLLNILS